MLITKRNVCGALSGASLSRYVCTSANRSYVLMKMFADMLPFNADLPSFLSVPTSCRSCVFNVLGFYQIYVDNELIKQGYQLSARQAIESGGHFVLGQFSPDEHNVYDLKLSYTGLYAMQQCLMLRLCITTKVHGPHVYSYMCII